MSAAGILTGDVKQAPVKKGGQYMDDLVKAMVGMSAARQAAHRGRPVEELASRITSALGTTAFAPGEATEYLSRLGMSPSEAIGEVYGRAMHALYGIEGAEGFFDPSLVAEGSTKGRSAGELAGSMVSKERVRRSFGEYTADSSTQAAIDQTTETSTSKSSQPILDDLIDAAKANTASAADHAKAFFQTTAGKWTVAGGLALGGYGLIRGMFGDEDSMSPPPMQMHQGSPLPPPPMLERPTDSGPKYVPVMNRPTARIAPTHPMPIPRHGQSRIYGGVPTAGMYTNDANTRAMRIEDATDPISRHEISRRMREVSNSDFTR
jgi:hypothetical protein